MTDKPDVVQIKMDKSFNSQASVSTNLNYSGSNNNLKSGSFSKKVAAESVL